jgi:hypothetical protein
MFAKTFTHSTEGLGYEVKLELKKNKLFKSFYIEFNNKIWNS